MNVKERTIAHYFGQSPRSDESASSLKENEAGSTPAREKNEVSKALSSDVLKCKTSGFNLNTEEGHTEKGDSEFTDKTIKKKQSVKRKCVRKKKAGVSDDEDFIVKSGRKNTSKRKRQQRKTQTETAFPDSESPPGIPRTESESISTNTSNLSAKVNSDQSAKSQEDATIVSPVSDVNASVNKTTSAKNILHFFSPTKSNKIELQPSVVKNIRGELQHEDSCQEKSVIKLKEKLDVKSSTADSQGESLPQLKLEKKTVKKAAVKRSQRKLPEDDVATGSTDSLKKSKKKNVAVNRKKISLNEINGGDTNDEQELASSPSKLTSSEIKSNMCNAFQMLMSKKVKTDSTTDFHNDSTANKGPHCVDEEENASLDNMQFVNSKKRNRIESESEDDDQSDQQKKMATEAVEANNQEQPRRKSLMKYFQKISKAEAEVQSQKVQFKVEALVHHSDGSPYKSKSTKTAQYQHKNLKKKRIKLVSNENDIEWLGSEEITVEDKSSPKSEEVENVLPESNQAEDRCQEETKSAEELVETRKKRSLKLNTPKSSPAGSKRLKKVAKTLENDSPSKSKRLKKVAKTLESEVSSTDSAEGQSQQFETPVKNMTSADNTELSQSPPPSVNQVAGKKLKQVSLDSSFLKKPSSGDTASLNVSDETIVNSTIVPSQRSPFVGLVKLSPNVWDAMEKTPSKSRKSFKSRSIVPVKVSDGEGPRKSLQQELSLKSPTPTGHPPSDSATPQARTWKMRVCLTPRMEANKTTSPLATPLTVDTDSEEDFDVQEIAVVKRKKVKSADLESKQLFKEIEIIHEEKIVSSNTKGAFKLAPLFMRPKKPDRISELAKQEFLLSGVPEQLKKVIEVQKSMECAEVEIFPRISHVTQLGDDLPWTPSEGRLPLKTECPESDPAPSESLTMGDLTTCDPVGVGMAEVLSNCSASLRRPGRRRIPTEHLRTALSLIRAEDSSFEVIHYFKILREKYRKVLDTDSILVDIKPKKRSRSSRRSRGSNQGTNSPKPKRNISNLMWTDKYRPTTCDAIVGNKDSVHGLKRWLECLRKTSQSSQISVSKAKKSKKYDDEDDFVMSDDNCDSNLSSSCSSNSALLLGCHGSGKTNCVYALAKDLGYKVLEINASERRSGKIILANLSEATQSHQVVNRSQEQAASFFSQKNSKTKASKRKIEKRLETEEELNKKKHGLILIKDVDVVFEEEDDGFVSAVASLISTSKRPVIFTATDKDCPHLKRIINSSTLLLEFIPDKRALCSWLQTIALVEGAYVSRAALKDLMSTCRHDVRQCLLQLQVWMATGGNHLREPLAAKDNDPVEVQEKALLEEFLQADITEEDLQTDVNRSLLTDFEHHDCIGALQGRNDIEFGKENNRVNIPVPMGLGRVWWNVPNFLSLPQVQVPELVLPEAPEQHRRFRGLFDDSLFDLTSDDEGTPNSQPMSSQPTSSQPSSSHMTNPVEESIPSVDNVAEPVSNDSEAVNVERCTQQELDAMLRHLQAMSTCDLILRASNLPEDADDFEPTPRYWRTSPRDSLSQSASKRAGPNLLIEETSRSMCHWLAEQSIQHARTVLLENPQTGRFDALLPGQLIERRRLDVQDAEIAALQIVANCARLERSAIALDYLPTLRRICASEQRRAGIKTSRRNRFYHYFKGLSLHLSSDQSTILSST